MSTRTNRAPHVSSGLPALMLLLTLTLGTVGNPIDTASMPTTPDTDMDTDIPFDGTFSHSMPPEVRNQLNAAITRVRLDAPGWPTALAVVSDALWVATTEGTYSALTRLPFDSWHPTGTMDDPGASLHLQAPVHVEGEVSHLLATDDSLWAAVATPPTASLLRLDPTTSALLQRFDLGSAVGDLVADNRAIWVAAGHEWRVWRINPESGEVATFDLRAAGEQIQHLPGVMAKSAGVWLVAHPDAAASGRAIAFAHPVGTEIVADDTRGPKSCLPVELTEYEREQRGSQQFRYTRCHLWVAHPFGHVSIYPMQAGAPPEQTLDVGGNVISLVTDGDHVWIATVQTHTGTYESALLRASIDARGAVIDEIERFTGRIPVALGHRGVRAETSRGNWLWVLIRRGYGHSELRAVIRAAIPPLPPLVAPTPTAP